jgi:hypothetical protein
MAVNTTHTHTHTHTHTQRPKTHCSNQFFLNHSTLSKLRHKIRCIPAELLQSEEDHNETESIIMPAYWQSVPSSNSQHSLKQ